MELKAGGEDTGLEKVGGRVGKSKGFTTLRWSLLQRSVVSDCLPFSASGGNHFWAGQTVLSVKVMKESSFSV